MGNRDCKECQGTGYFSPPHDEWALDEPCSRCTPPSAWKTDVIYACVACGRCHGDTPCRKPCVACGRAHHEKHICAELRALRARLPEAAE